MLQIAGLIVRNCSEYPNSNMSSAIPPNERISSIFQENVCIRGNLELTQPLLLDGKLFGNIKSESHVIIGEKGYVEGEIEAENVTVWGILKGNLNSKSTCILQNVATVEGDITSAKLAIKEGASFVGQAKVNQKSKKDIPEVIPVVNRLKDEGTVKSSKVEDESNADISFNRK